MSCRTVSNALQKSGSIMSVTLHLSTNVTLSYATRFVRHDLPFLLLNMSGATALEPFCCSSGVALGAALPSLHRENKAGNSGECSGESHLVSQPKFMHSSILTGIEAVMATGPEALWRVFVFSLEMNNAPSVL